MRDTFSRQSFFVPVCSFISVSNDLLLEISAENFHVGARSPGGFFDLCLRAFENVGVIIQN